MSAKFAHVTFVVTDIDKTVDFYREFFGLTIVRDRRLVEGPKDSGGAVGYWALFRDPDDNLIEATCGQPIRGV